MIKIMISDDHAIVREGLKQILVENPDFIVAGEAENGMELLNKVRKEDYDLILLDISMPGKSGLEILKQLRIEKPNIPVLVLSVHQEDQYALRTIKAGASGYLTKESAPEELISAIKKDSLGGKYVSTSLAEKLASYLDMDKEGPPHESLSDREYQVMLMIASGTAVKEIAERLSLSVKTISTNRTRILNKMGMKNNAEMIHYAIKQRLVD